MSGLFGIAKSFGKEVVKAADEFSQDVNNAIYDSPMLSGLFKSFTKEVSSAASSISKEVGIAAKKVEDTWDERATSTLLNNFRTGNVVQLVSRSSGHCLQLVTAATGQLVVDGCGPEGPQVYHAHWTIINEGKNIVRLHNNNNYLAIVNGTAVVIQFPQPHLAAVETRFRLHQTGQFICLESEKGLKSHIGVLPSGQLKSALATGKEIDGQWGVRLVYTPYQPAYPAQQPNKVVKVQGGTQVVQQGNTTYVTPGAGRSVIVTQTTTTTKK